MSRRLVLGTSQFGFHYGIANQVGQVSRDEVTEILGHARAAGLDTLDTAIDYGGSEAVLGGVGVDQWQVITKLPEVPDDCACISSWITGQIENSLMKLS